MSARLRRDTSAVNAKMNAEVRVSNPLKILTRLNANPQHLKFISLPGHLSLPSDPANQPPPIEHRGIHKIVPETPDFTLCVLGFQAPGTETQICLPCRSQSTTAAPPSVPISRVGGLRPSGKQQ